MADMGTPRPGLTYICQEDNEGDVLGAALVCHFNNGDLDNVKEPFDYYGYVHDPSDIQPKEDEYWTDFRGNIEGRYCETLLRPAKPHPYALNPYTIFARWMIHPQAAELGIGADAVGVGFPVGWAVRGFLPEELTRRHLTNSMNMLPVFRSDFQELGVLSPRRLKMRRVYYVWNAGTKAHTSKKMPMSLQEQIDGGRVRPEEEPLDIAGAKWEGPGFQLEKKKKGDGVAKAVDEAESKADDKAGSA